MLFAGEFLVRQALADDLFHRGHKAVSVIHPNAVVETKRLFIDIAEKMKGFNGHVRAIDRASGAPRSSQCHWYAPAHRRRLQRD